jgi:hypothetical protein
MAMAASVKEGTSNLGHRNLMPTVMVWVRKMPGTTNPCTPAITVVGTVTHRLHACPLASIVNIFGSH